MIKTKSIWKKILSVLIVTIVISSMISFPVSAEGFNIALSNPTDISSNTIGFAINLTSQNSIELSKVKIRYYYTVENNKQQNIYIDAAGISSGANYISITKNVTYCFKNLSSLNPTVNKYLELGFDNSCGSIDSSEYVSIRVRITNDDWSNQDQSNDYSYNNAAKIAIYYDGMLAYGTPPSGIIIDTSWYTNNPTSKTFSISTAEELAGLAKLVNDGTDTFENKTITLANDIVLNDTTGWSSWDENTTGLTSWTPIGTNINNQFNGAFNGNNHTVSGIYITGSSDYQGLFGCVDKGGTVTNLGVEKSNIIGCFYVGGVVGGNTGTITNCYNTGIVSGAASGAMYVGGVVGANDGSITNCYNTGIVSGAISSLKYVGGVAGSNDGSITNCYNTGAVNGLSIIGGVAGDNTGAITNCYNTGAVTGSNYVGGVVGYNNKGTITNCYNTGTVSGSVYVGGVVGDNDGYINYCYWNSTAYTGNCVGNDNGSISNCAAKTSTEMKSNAFLDLLNDWVDDNKTLDPTPEKWKQSSKVNNGYLIFNYQKAPFDNPTTTAEISNNTSNNAEVSTNKKTTTTAVTTTAETQPEPKTGGTSGWTNIEEKILKADSGDEIYINMNGTTTVPKSIMSDIMGKDVSITFDMGTYSWTINGKNITNAQNVNLGLTYTPNVIDFDTVSVLAGGKPIMQFQLDYNGSFGFVGTCTLQLPPDKAGQYANLYYYNPETGKLEFQTCGLIKSNGYVELDFSHASDYVIVVDKTAMGTISAGAVSEDNAKPLNTNGMVYIAILIAFVVGGIAVKKKAKK